MHKFLIHNQGDHVGVATSPIQSGEKVTGVYMDTDEKVDVTSHGDIPLGHKIAVADLAEGESVIKYLVTIGETTASLSKGDYVHTHNIKTKRW
ncbi:UxaA family hydrolase [Salibacterium halotolerans]|uniref:(2R)-sulfolactate sulfo-lyase subunit alpha n=1 Tax=Salibacterium halotolerans TaxID=1884432 RepID=A0A1I5LC72_9BACI|nr:UxaA family hydrolase [Salibacterium halotolerans]SFO94964.1 (2R)-sulfolactate sulfo-lyase subunit alpha [Salibacterium halotolerans]